MGERSQKMTDNTKFEVKESHLVLLVVLSIKVSIFYICCVRVKIHP